MPTDHDEKSANQPVANAATLLNDNIGITVAGGLIWLFGIFLFWVSPPLLDNWALVLSLSISSVLVGCLLGYRVRASGFIQVLRVSFGVGGRVAGFWFVGAGLVEYFVTDWTATATVVQFPGLLLSTFGIVVVAFLVPYLVSQALKQSWKRFQSWTRSDILSALGLFLALLAFIDGMYDRVVTDSAEEIKKDRPLREPWQKIWPWDSSSESKG